MSPVSTADITDTTERPAPGRSGTPAVDIDPELLAVLTRVAHGEYLLGAAPGAHPTTLTRPVRRRPRVRTHSVRSSRGTTARKVTWSR